MIIRTKGGAYRVDTASVLLEYLGITQRAAGVQKVAADVELVASVPFCLTADGENENGFSWTLSTFDLDRFDERIDPQGWDLKRYLENPVVQWAHRFDIPAIGKVESLVIDDDGLHGRVFFNGREYDQFGWSIGERVKHGVIRAGSVGFRAIEIEIPAASDSKDGTSLIFRKQELLEFSICNVPANPFALARNTGGRGAALQDGGEQKKNGEEGEKKNEETETKEETGNEEKEMGGESGNSADHFWDCVISNMQGA